MRQGTEVYTPQDWKEARGRAATYLRALGAVGQAEQDLLNQALRAAHEAPATGSAKHPVTRVMEALFDLLPHDAGVAPIAMTPPIQRVKMLPEPIEFPIHDGLRQVVQLRELLFAEAH